MIFRKKNTFLLFDKIKLILLQSIEIFLNQNFINIMITSYVTYTKPKPTLRGCLVL